MCLNVTMTQKKGCIMLLHGCIMNIDPLAEKLIIIIIIIIIFIIIII